MWLNKKPVSSTGMSTLSLDRYSPYCIFFFFEATMATAGMATSGVEWVCRTSGVMWSYWSLRLWVSRPHATMPNRSVVTDSARAHCPAMLEGCVCRIASCQCVQISTMISALGGVRGPYPLHVFDHLHCKGVSHISKSSTGEAISANHSCAFVWTPCGNIGPKPRQPYLPKLPLWSHMCLFITSEHTVTIRSGVEKEKQKNIKPETGNVKQGTREDTDAGEKREGVGDDVRSEEGGIRRWGECVRQGRGTN